MRPRQSRSGPVEISRCELSSAWVPIPHQMPSDKLWEIFHRKDGVELKTPSSSNADRRTRALRDCNKRCDGKTVRFRDADSKFHS